MRAKLVLSSTAGGDHHDTGRSHPERPERLAAALAGVGDVGLGGDLLEIHAQPASMAELERVHDPRYLRALADFADGGGGSLDPDTVVSRGSWTTAVLAAGAGLAAIDELRNGRADAALVLARPPGHHATRARGQGFCLLNNVAAAAAALTAAGERVVIVDWDVHHGNGTQDIFWDDPRVLYVSTHQWPAYPGTGRPDEIGGPSARGLTVNFPLPPGATGDVAAAAFDEVVGPAVERFGATWVLVSCGFDAHRDDPLADLAWSAGDYAALARRVSSYAPAPGRVALFLEGGYDLRALRASTAAAVTGLAGGTWSGEPATAGGPGRDVVDLVGAFLRDAAARG